MKYNMARKPHDPLDTIEGVVAFLVFLVLVAVSTGLIH